MYRYRDHSGATRRSLEAMKHLPKIGRPTTIRGYCHKGKYNKQLAVLVKGDKGSARFGAFNWGYSGEGPRGLRQLFDALRIPVEIADHVTCKVHSPDWDKVRKHWQINMDQNGSYDLYVFDSNNRIVERHEYRLAKTTVTQKQLF